ncbi:hypothetical protein LCGC14_3001080 [marine sediment metagenome]|uniref:Uncharacterized protein n=1 Tax=marine sediment metagenome TaxID=412755 RepID=A0A0F8X1G4_9ZZZZ
MTHSNLIGLLGKQAARKFSSENSKNRIMEIIKTYKISNWCQYDESPVGDVSGMEETNVNTIMGGHPCVITTHLDDNGSGFEKRVFRPLR